MTNGDVYSMKDGGVWTVGALRKALDGEDATALLILYSDAEGNDFKPVFEVEVGVATVQIEHGYADVDVEKGRPAVYLRPFD